MPFIRGTIEVKRVKEQLIFRLSPSGGEIWNQDMDLPIIHSFHTGFRKISNFDENQVLDN